MSLLAELKRRNVIRMAGLYLVGAWLVTQVSSTILPMFSAPDWLPRAIVVLLALGFVPTLIFAWVFELTPEGIKRDADVPPGQSIAPQTARRMDRMIIVVLVLALGYFGFDKFVLAPRRDVALIAATTESVKAGVMNSPASATNRNAPAPDDKSIAVLPFADLSPAHDQEYLSDGMAEEILDALAKVQNLKVAGRTSSFYFKGKNEKLTAIGAALGVANVLEGSVRKQGDKVRVTAQLIRTSSGFHLWSESYDGDLKDVFELQERIARAITDSLRVVLQNQADRLAPTSTGNAFCGTSVATATCAVPRLHSRPRWRSIPITPTPGRDWPRPTGSCPCTSGPMRRSARPSTHIRWRSMPLSTHCAWIPDPARRCRRAH
jgi:adenylate cyclase